MALPKSVTPSRIDSNLKDIVLPKEDLEELTQQSNKIPHQRVCDQSEDFEFDIVCIFFYGVAWSECSRLPTNSMRKITPKTMMWLKAS